MLLSAKPVLSVVNRSNVNETLNLKKLLLMSTFSDFQANLICNSALEAKPFANHFFPLILVSGEFDDASGCFALKTESPAGSNASLDGETGREKVDFEEVRNEHNETSDGKCDASW